MISPFQYSQSPHSHSNNNEQISFFRHQLLTIDQYVQLIENDFQQAKISQLVCQRGFYKNQLKSALYLNSIFVKMCQQKELLIQQLYLQIAQLKKKDDHFNHDQSFDKSENSINRGNNINTPKQKLKSAFNAEKNILDAKFSHQKEYHKKFMQQSDELLKNLQQENKYLRENLLNLSQQIILQKRKNEELNKLNQQFHLKNIELTKIMNEKIEKHSNNILNFSPIAKKDEVLVDQDISFNKYCLIQQNNDPLILKKQIQEQKQILKQLKNKYQNTQNQIILSKSIPYYEQLEKKYHQMKNDLTEKLQEIDKYKDIAIQIREIEKISKNYEEQKTKLEEQIKALKNKLSFYEQGGLSMNTSFEECKQCLKLKNLLCQQDNQLSKLRQQLLNLKMRLDKTIHLQLNQRKQWDQFLKGIDQSSIQ